MTLTSESHIFDTIDDAIEGQFDLGVTDGLPVIPPTSDRVMRMLQAGGVAADVVLGDVPTRDVEVTVEKVAINAVMAGCRPEYFPTVLAAVRAFLQPKANAHSTTATLAGSAHAVIVNGPVAEEIGVHGGQACFGPGFRANATIGRALRLVIRNVCRTVPGVLDRASFSWPLRYSFCFAENEAASQWEPLHMQHGYQRTDSVVTIQSVMRLIPVTEFAPEADNILETIWQTARLTGLQRDDWAGDDRSIVIVIGPEHQRRLVGEGWTKQAISEFLHPRLNADTLGKFDQRLVLAGPQNVMLVAAGGPGIAQSWIISPHLSVPTHERVVNPA